MRIVTLEEHFAIPMPGRPERQRRSAADDNVPTVIRNVGGQDHRSRRGPYRRHGSQRHHRAGTVEGGRPHQPERRPVRGQGGDRAFRANSTTAFAEKIAERPDRFAAFAHLAASIPEAAADELERTVTVYGFKGALINGTIRGQFLDDPKFAPLFARAEKLDVPLYIHPGMPPDDVRKAYYEGFPEKINFGLATFAWGWHYEAALHVMRLAVCGTVRQISDG